MKKHKFQMLLTVKVYFLLKFHPAHVHVVASVMSDSLWSYETVAHQAPWDSLGKNTGVGCHALLQGIFPTQGLNPHLLYLPALAGWFFTTSSTWEALEQVKKERKSINPQPST